MIKTTLCKDTVLAMLETQLLQYLMVEKYGLRADRNVDNPEHIVIPPEEIKSDIESLFGKNNEKLIESLWWVINDTVANYEPSGWDDEITEEDN